MTMKARLARYWWVFLLRGVFAIAFAAIAFVNPAIALASLVLLWGAYTFGDGVVSLIAAVSGKTGDDERWMVGLQGILGVVAGLLTLILPGATAMGLLLAMAAWSLAVGVLQIVAAIRLRREIEGEFWLGLSGLLSVLFAFLVMARPGEGALAIIWLIGSFALVFGVSLLAFAFRIRKERTSE